VRARARAKEVRKPKVEKYRREASIRHDMQASDRGGRGKKGGRNSLSFSPREEISPLLPRRE